MVKTREGGKGEDVALHVYNKFQKFVLYKFVFLQIPKTVSENI